MWMKMEPKENVLQKPSYYRKGQAQNWDAYSYLKNVQAQLSFKTTATKDIAGVMSTVKERLNYEVIHEQKELVISGSNWSRV